MTDAQQAERIYDTHSLDHKFPGLVTSVALKQDPHQFNEETFDDLLRHAIEHGASEINLQSDYPAMLEIEGRLCRVTRRPLNMNEIGLIVNHVYGSNGTTLLNSGADVNIEYPVKVTLPPNGPGERSRQKIYNFRFNAVACLSPGAGQGAQITMRAIPPTPPQLASLGLEEEILPHLRPQGGVVLVGGPTGSGKSTLLAAIVRDILEDPNSHKKIATYDSPPEFTFWDVPRAAALLSQHDVPRHCVSYAEAVRSSLRRMTRVLVIGECREHETIDAVIMGSKTGQVVYTTGHADSIPIAIGRFADLFPPELRMGKVFELVGQLRVAVVQRLLPRCDNAKRVAIREYLVFDQEVRDRVRQAATLVEVETILKALVEERGQSMLTAAMQQHELGHIDYSEVQKIEAETKASLTESLF